MMKFEKTRKFQKNNEYICIHMHVKKKKLKPVLFRSLEDLLI